MAVVTAAKRLEGAGGVRGGVRAGATAITGGWGVSSATVVRVAKRLEWAFKSGCNSGYWRLESGVSAVPVVGGRLRTEAPLHCVIGSSGATGEPGVAFEHYTCNPPKVTRRRPGTGLRGVAGQRIEPIPLVPHPRPRWWCGSPAHP